MSADLTLILDRSGSMSSCRDGTIEMFNAFLNGQREAVRLGQITESYTVSLVQFDDHYEPNYEATPLPEAAYLSIQTYVPRGWTALLDAMGRTIDAIGKRLSSLSPEQRPDKVVVVVITDGFENSSKEYTQKRVAEMVRHQTEVYKWTFVFLGANQDAILSAKQYDIPVGGALNLQATNAGMRAMGHAICSGAVAAFATPAMMSGQVMPQQNNFFLPGAQQYVDQR